jgi:excisionase family DNA binding protein
VQARVLTPKWHTVAEVAHMLGFGKSKTQALILQGEIRSIKVGRNRRILPRWIDEYVERLAQEVEDAQQSTSQW